MNHMSKESLLLFAIAVFAVSFVCMTAGILLAAWFHDAWWLLVTGFGLMLYLVIR